MVSDDPIIREIREARRKIQEQCGNDIHRMYLYYVEQQKQHEDRLVCWNADKTALIPFKDKPPEPK